MIPALGVRFGTARQQRTFFGDGGYGSNLVLRSRDPEELARALDELVAALREAGVTDVREVENA